MTEIWAWLAEAVTDMQKAGQIATVIFFATFTAILIYVFTGKRRKERFDSYRYIPLEGEEDEKASTGPAGHHQPKGNSDDGQ
ncbi:cbb3-type cytochrome oxidase subunit 3 [Thiohalorhabdus sp.]|uniref:cbb3-type cytochrome oxidase subunit 3 n=1 Tax=Thiohalorhabdus sp. TaxID=3094134 RepID=UPI002FC34475